MTTTERPGRRGALRELLHSVGSALMWASCRLAYVAFRLQGKRGSGVQIHLIGDHAEWRR